MTEGRPAFRALALVLASLLGSAAGAGEAVLRTPATRLALPLTSFHELRQRELVRQQWDVSCGAAALSTLLTYHHGLPVSELAIATSILRGGDPDRVRERGGFSLLDLKRFSEAIGLEANGYGGMSMADLEAFGPPAILPVTIRNYDHFIVYRGTVGGRVLFGDPAFGNLTVPVERFEAMWTSGIGFYVTRPGARQPDASALTPSETDMPVPDLLRVQRLLRGGGPSPWTRKPDRLP